MITGKIKWITERNIFYALLGFNVFMMLTVKFYPSMDGPSHLYNSKLIAHLLKGDSPAINEFYTLNKMIIPNWTSHFILSLFNLFLPAWVAEKILLVFYLCGISISFRLLIKQLCPDNPAMSLFIIPFAYSFLFYLGFYNYCLSFVFLFFTLFYWLKNAATSQPLKYVWLFVLLMGTYFSAVLTFSVLVFCLGLLIMAGAIERYSAGLQLTLLSRKTVKELLLLLAISLPGLVLSAFFIHSTHLSGSNNGYTTGDLIKWLNDVRCIIVYEYPREEKWTAQFLHVIIVVFSISLFTRFRDRDFRFEWRMLCKSDLFIIPLLLVLFLYFKVPNDANAGMMSDRFCLLVYMFLIVWISSQYLPYRVSQWVVGLIIFFQIGLLFNRHNGMIRDLNKDAGVIYNASKYMEENSIVLPVNLSDNWIETHFSSYLGIDKPLVILENYEATVGWFPVRWNDPALPRVKLGESDGFANLGWNSNLKSAHIKQIDYVFLYGNTAKVNDSTWTQLKSTLDKHYLLIFSSADHYAVVYKKN
jgi:hypothetical protein